MVFAHCARTARWLLSHISISTLLDRLQRCQAFRSAFSPHDARTAYKAILVFIPCDHAWPKADLRALRDNLALFRHISTRILTISFNPISMLRLLSHHCTQPEISIIQATIYASFAGGAKYTHKDIMLTSPINCEIIRGP